MSQTDKSLRLGWVLPCATPCLAVGILLGRAAENAYPALIAMLCALVAALVTQEKLRKTAVCAFFLAFGIVHGSMAYHPTLPAVGTYTVTGVVAEEIRFRADGQVRTVLQDVTLNGESISGGVYWTCYPQEDMPFPENLLPGSRVTLQARIYHPKGADNPGGFDFKDYLLQRGIHLGLYGMNDLTVEDAAVGFFGWSARVRHELTKRLVDVMGEEAGNYASTMLLGSRNLIPSEDRAAFNRMGIAHILSVSGYHVGVLAGMLMLVMSALHVRWGWRVLVTAVVLGFYAMLTGLNPPVVRAAVLVVLYQIGRWQHRQNNAPHLLLACAMLQLLASPTQLTGASFQLSYGAMAGLVLVAPYLQRRWSPKRKRLKRLWRAVSATIAAQLGVLLPTLYWFQELPLLAIFFNIIVLAGSSLLLTAQWIVLALLPVPWISQVAGAAIGWVTNWLLWLIRAVGGASWLSVRTGQVNALTVMGLLFLMAGLTYIWPFRRKWLLISGPVLLAASLIFLPYPYTTYMQFSVGNADAALIRSHDVTVAIDTGEDGAELASYLVQEGLNLDALVLTHLHSDHAGGIQALLEEDIAVARVYLPVGAQQAEIDEGMSELLEALLSAGTELSLLARGDRLLVPDGEMTVLWPERGKVRPGMDANLHCLVAHLTLSGTSLLLTGDLDGLYEDYVAVPADILKAAHHGSKDSTSAAFLQTVSPQTVLLSGGDEDRYLSMQERCGTIPLYGTYADGAIIIDFSDDGYTVKTMHERSVENGT